MKKNMMSVVYRGAGDIRLEPRPVPVLRDPLDAIVQVTRSTICTLSLIHILQGRCCPRYGRKICRPAYGCRR